MSITTATKQHFVKVCAKVAIVVLLFTGLLPVFFFHFPGPQFFAFFSYEDLWAFTHLLWKPLRLLSEGSPFLRQHLNPYLVAPLLNSALAFVIACCLLWFLRTLARKNAHDA